MHISKGRDLNYIELSSEELEDFLKFLKTNKVNEFEVPKENEGPENINSVDYRTQNFKS